MELDPTTTYMTYVACEQSFKVQKTNILYDNKYLKKVTYTITKILHQSEIISHSKNLGESKHIKFDQNYRKNYKDL